MAKKEERPRQVSVLATLKEEVYRVNMFFNRFAVEALGRHLLVHFGLLQGRNLLASYSCVLESETINASRASMLAFLDAIEPTESETESWNPPMEVGGVETCNIIHMARSGQIGEVRIGLYSTGVAIEARKTAQTKFDVRANPLALLHCDLDVQKQLLTALFIDTPSHA